MSRSRGDTATPRDNGDLSKLAVNYLEGRVSCKQVSEELALGTRREGKAAKAVRRPDGQR